MKKVVVIGDVIEDIIVISDGERKANTDNPATIQSTPGGSGANFAVWLASLGVEVELIARVGIGESENLSKYFLDRGVNAKFELDAEIATGRIVDLVEKNQRTFFTFRGANKNLILENVNLLNASLLYISGYSVFSLGKTKTQALISKARSLGVLIAVDPGSASFIASFGPREFLDAIQGCNFLFPNEEEFAVLNSGGVPLEQLFDEVVVTRGESGSELLGIAFESADLGEVVDTTGAGDAFAAKYLDERLALTSPKQALKSANSFALRAISQVGGQPRQPH